MQLRAERSLWAALRALEDQVAWIAWQEREGKQPPARADEVRRNAETLRQIVTLARTAG